MRTATFALIVTTTLLSPRYASAEKSNQTQVRASLSKGGYTVIYGDKFTESDWIAAGASIYASIQAGNPEPFFKWMTSELNATVNKVQQQLPGVARDQILQLLRQSLTSGKVVQINGMYISAGIATYNRWEEVSGHYPEFGPWGVKWTHGSTKTALPNWHDPYIRFRINKAGQQPKPSQIGPKPPKNVPPSKFPPHSISAQVQSITITCNDKQEGSGDDIYLIVKPDGKLQNVQQVAGVGPSLKWKMRDGDSRQVGKSGLQMFDFYRYLEVIVVEYDSLSDNEVLSTLHFEPGKQASKTFTHGKFPRKCRYTVNVDARPSH